MIGLNILFEPAGDALHLTDQCLHANIDKIFLRPTRIVYDWSRIGRHFDGREKIVVGRIEKIGLPSWCSKEECSDYGNQCSVFHRQREAITKTLDSLTLPKAQVHFKAGQRPKSALGDVTNQSLLPMVLALSPTVNPEP